MKLSTKLFSLTLCFLSLSQVAYGYIDPGTGTYIIQILIAAFATILYTIKYFWKNIKDFFARLRGRLRLKKAPAEKKSFTPAKKEATEAPPPAQEGTIPARSTNLESNSKRP